mgnify:CR=1 FL=1
MAIEVGQYSKLGDGTVGNIRAEEPFLVARNVNAHYGDIHAIRDVSIEIGNKEVIALIGPSGAGKSTMIRCINRLVEPSHGTVMLDDTDLTKLGKVSVATKMEALADVGDVSAFRALANAGAPGRTGGVSSNSGGRTNGQAMADSAKNLVKDRANYFGVQQPWMNSDPNHALPANVRLGGLKGKTAVIHAGLEALIARESARRLAALPSCRPRQKEHDRRGLRYLRDFLPLFRRNLLPV